MDETVIVIMLKNKKTGFLEKELGGYSLEYNEDVVYNAFAEETEEGTYVVYMKLTCGRDVEDWEFQAIYDYYDMDSLKPYISSIQSDEEQYNPTWVVSFPFIEDVDKMEKALNQIVSVHKEELDSVFDVIANKKDDYIDGE